MVTAPGSTAPDGVPAWVDREQFPFVNRWVTVGDGRLHYVDEGAGETILFVHGTPSWSFEWRRLIRELSGTHRCVAIDHLGFGLSDRPLAAQYTPEAHAVRLRAAVTALGLRDVTLVVHDYGGPIALPLALDGLASRLVVLNSFMWPLGDDPAIRRAGMLFGGTFGRLLYEYLNFSLRIIMPAAYADKRKLTPAIHRQYLSTFPDRASRGAVLWPLARALLGSTSWYQSLWARREALRAVPALLIWGTRDPAFGPRYLERWRSVLPQATVAEVDAGHWPQEEAPDDVIQAIRRFL